MGGIYHDYAGNLSFKKGESGESNVVSCACFIPCAEEEKVLEILPRGSNGLPLKSTDSELTEENACIFLDSFLALPVHIGILMVDVGGPDSIQAIEIVQTHANERRKAQHKRNVSKLAVAYCMFTTEPILLALMAKGEELGEFPKRFSITLDQEEFGRQQTELFRWSTIATFLKHGSTVSHLHWKSRLENNLLFVPDLIAGLIYRHGTTGEAFGGIEALAKSSERRQTVIRDGKKLDLKALGISD